MGGYSSQANDIVNQFAIAVANWSTAVAIASVQWLLSLMGQSTEPNLTVIVPVYDRMLAISLLLVGAKMFDEIEFAAGVHQRLCRRDSSPASIVSIEVEKEKRK